MGAHDISRRRRVFVLLAGLALSQAGSAWCGTFSVNPTRVLLSAETTSGLVSLRNDSDQPLRLQLSVFAWDQIPSGEMRLTPTEDIVFFPHLLTVSPHEERKVRVGSLAVTGPVEKTYRLFVEELPPAEGPAPGVIRVVTRMGIPIFLEPASRRTGGRIGDLAYAAGNARFTVFNIGNTWFIPDQIRVQLLGRDGQILAERSVDGWYILGGGSRLYDVELSAPSAADAATLAVQVVLGSVTLSERIAIARETARH